MALKGNLQGKCYTDKGYISKEMFNKLYKRGLLLITGIKRNMKNDLLPILNKILLRKRFIIETIFGYIKENFNVRLSKHRSPTNLFAFLFATLIAFQIKSPPNLLSRISYS